MKLFRSVPNDFQPLCRYAVFGFRRWRDHADLDAALADFLAEVTDPSNRCWPRAGKEAPG